MLSHGHEIRCSSSGLAHSPIPSERFIESKISQRNCSQEEIYLSFNGISSLVTLAAKDLYLCSCRNCAWEHGPVQLKVAIPLRGVIWWWNPNSYASLPIGITLKIFHLQSFLCDKVKASTIMSLQVRTALYMPLACLLPCRCISCKHYNNLHAIDHLKIDF